LRKRSITTNSGNDVVYTPRQLAKDLVEYYSPKGRILEPCKGGGAFFDAFPKDQELFWAEISEGKNFFDFTEKVNWIITNPPFSILLPFLKHSLELSDNVVFLIPINHFSTKARIRSIREAGFHVEDILLLESTPKEFPQSGFQWGAVHLKRTNTPNWKFIQC
jgi:hypothetical protein